MTPQLHERMQLWRTQWREVNRVDRAPGLSDFVFPVPGKNGQRRSKESDYGIPDLMLAATNGRIRRFHALRHTAATLMVQANIDLSTVQEVLGHSSIRTTEKYRHLQDTHKVEQMAKLNLSIPRAIADDAGEASVA